jgi:hypothetical protein
MANDYNQKRFLINQEGAIALLAATFDFLRRNNISDKVIIDYAHQHHVRYRDKKLASYKRFMRAYEDMGILMSTWFSQPSFLDKEGRPVPLTIQAGPHSVANLIRLSGVRIPRKLVLDLMRRSPSIDSNSDGRFLALSRVFVLPELKVPRAAFVVERYLDTLRRNSSLLKGETTLLVERSCHVSGVNLRAIAPTLRDIKGRGRAFMDSVDGELEALRVPRRKCKRIGELGVLIFSWTRPRNGSLKAERKS